MEIVFCPTGGRLVRKTVEAAYSRVGRYNAITKFHEGKLCCFYYLKLGGLPYQRILGFCSRPLSLDNGNCFVFYLVSGVAIVIGTGLMGFLIRRFGILTTYAFGANVFAALMINYIMRKFFIFKS